MPFLSRRTYPSGRKVWAIYYRKHGKQRSKVIGAVDRRTAEKAFSTFCARLVSGTFGIRDVTPISLPDFFRLYLEYAIGVKAPHTVRREHQLIDVFSKAFKAPEFQLIEITAEDLLRYRSQRLLQVSKATVNLEFRHLKAIFNTARSLGYLDNNPFDSIKPLRIASRNLPRFFELGDIERIRKRFGGDELESLVNFYLLTGARLDEALKLTRDDLDLTRALLTIRGIYSKSGNHRIVAFGNDPALATLLRKQGLTNDQYLFGPPDNRPRWSADWVSRRISGILTELGYPWASVHTFRHTYISHLMMAGVPINTVRELIGHSSIRTTLLYAHLAPCHKRSMAAKRPY